ncbi:hypothetical protein D9613_010116 [Agrocybe pediades]|uniref:DUF6534 domain-containing protein n=1 Tax=Agrocybe pediades TaxID=84607 RepID=A0A8H4QYA2_9AGAR|nr:hypothetical protein D9613_010116 [Agrocybe pediades]
MENMQPPLQVPDINISKAVDGVFVGYVASTILLGITILQAWNYAQTNRDGWKLRSFVALLVILDTSAAIANTVMVEHFGNFLLLGTVIKPVLVEFSFTVIVIFLVQLFFATRVYLLNPGKYWLAGGIAFGSLLAFVSTIYTIGAEVRHTGIQDFKRPGINVSAIVHQVLIILVDGCITIVLSWNFIKARSQSQVKRTQGILQTLLTFVVARGLLITLTDTAFLILWLINDTNLNWMPIHLSLSKIYVISMIALLNARTHGPTRDAQRIFTDNNSFQLTSSGPPAFALHPSSTTTAKNYSINESTLDDGDPSGVVVTHETHIYRGSSTEKVNAV